jgi:hypothetical protein
LYETLSWRPSSCTAVTFSIVLVPHHPHELPGQHLICHELTAGARTSLGPKYQIKSKRDILKGIKIIKSKTLLEFWDYWDIIVTDGNVFGKKWG